MEEYTNLIADLSDLAGIIPEYYDIFGKKHVTSPESRVAILRAMGLNVASADDITREITKKKNRKWTGLVDPVTVISQFAQPHKLAIHLPVSPGAERGLKINVTIEDEEGKKETLEFHPGNLPIDGQQEIENTRFFRFLLPLPERNIGYYAISVVCSHPERVFEHNGCSLHISTRLIVTPDSCYMPEQLKHGKSWGLALNLYALRSRTNWGIGDLGDLRKVVTWFSGLNGGAVGINPLHAIPNTIPFGISPYSPISRLYRNFIYIDMDAVPEVSELPDGEHYGPRIESFRKSEQIDYEGVAALKREVLELAFEIFLREHYWKDSERAKNFREYLQTEGQPLENFAVYLAIAEHMKKECNACSWKEWPKEYRSPRAEGVEDFRNTHHQQVLFFQYVQWLIDMQLAEAGSAGELPIGLYGDLAIGAVDTGSDGWGYQDVLAESVTVGAPPDDFNTNGQDWGFPPMNPHNLWESGYDLFIYTIRKNMRHMGALRIDHALGLFRLFWVPKGMHPQDGAYVRCNAEDLIRIIALESVRNKTLVIGEDLGTITDEARNALQRFGILSYRLFYFERNYPDPSFLLPERYPHMALTAVTTHDLPTLSGYWVGRDLEMKKQLGIIRDDQQHAQLLRDRDRDRKLMLRVLSEQGMFHTHMDDPSFIQEMSPELCLAIYRYLSVSPAKLVLVSLDDVIATLDQQNMPGTVSEHPNWRQKTPPLLEEIITDQRFNEIAGMFRVTRAKRIETVRTAAM